MTSLVPAIKGRAYQERQTKEDPAKCHKKVILVYMVQEPRSISQCIKNANTNQNKAKNVATSLWVELRAASGKKDFTMTQGLVLQTTRAQPI